MRRRYLSLLLSAVLAATLLLQPAHAAFFDVHDSDWYYDSVLYARDHGLFRGVTTIEFAPGDIMSRAMFVTVMFRAARAEDVYAPSGFSDVESGSWYDAAVRWGKATGIVEGTSDTTFSPDAPVTREDMCTFMLRLSEQLSFSLPEQAEPMDFTDAADIHAYALEAVKTCQTSGLITGYEDGAMRPANPAARAEVSTIFARLGRLLEAQGLPVGPGYQPWDDWALTLVNRWNYIPDGYVDHISLSGVGSGYQLDSRICSDFQEMIRDMRRAGLSPSINSAFRTNSYQNGLYQKQIKKQLSYGYSYQKAVEQAQMWVAVPGTSEHELGLAVDISMYKNDSKAIYAWLQNNSYHYGFIYRYASDKIDITGVYNEPWHYRYVGRDHAYAIYQSGLCLEEYLDVYTR